MAEHFYGKSKALHMSNGAAEMFIAGLLYVACENSTVIAHQEVQQFLRERLECGDGGRSFTLYPIPQELDSPERLDFLALCTRLFANLLVLGRVPPSLAEDLYDRELELRFIAFASEFYDLLVESSSSDTLPVMNLPFDNDEDAVVVQIERLARRQIAARKSQPRNWPLMLSFIEEELRLYSRLTLKMNDSERRASILSRKAAVLEEMHRYKEAATCLREAAAIGSKESAPLYLESAQTLDEMDAEVTHQGDVDQKKT